MPFIAGVSTSTDSIARFMARHGHRVRVISPTPVIKVANEEKELELIYTPSFKDFFFNGKPTSPWPLPFPVMVKEITKEKTDIVHIQEAGAVGTAALIYAKLRKIPAVGALHVTPEQLVRFVKINPGNITLNGFKTYLRNFYNLCQGIMVPTETFAGMLRDIGVKKKIVVVSNGVDTEKFHPEPKNKTLQDNFSLPANKIIFFYLGRIDKDKNIDTIIKALPDTSDQVHLVIAGKGRREELLRQLAKDLNVLNKITWIGYLNDQEIVDIYHAVDCFVIMSPYEVQSIVTLQAIACGLPVIAANAGALPELAQEECNGFLVGTYDHKTLANKMDSLAGDANLRNQMGIESRKIALPHEKSVNLKKLEDFYLALTNCPEMV